MIFIVTKHDCVYSDGEYITRKKIVGYADSEWEAEMWIYNNRLNDERYRVAGNGLLYPYYTTSRLEKLD